MKYAPLVLFLLISGCITRIDTNRVALEDLISRTFEHKMISSGNNFPAVNVRAKHRTEILLGLGYGNTPDEIAEHLGIDISEVREQLDVLVDAGLAVETESGFAAGVTIMSTERVEAHMTVGEDVISQAYDIVVARQEEVWNKVETMNAFAGIPRRELSLLILSDVLLDNWQINAIEDEFLGGERPLRGETRYYYALQENNSSDGIEAFGIYGNSYRGFDGVTLGVYGNRRNENPLNLGTLDADGIGDHFGIRPDSTKSFKSSVLAEYVAYVRNDTELTAPVREGLENLEWVVDGEPSVPVLTSEENRQLRDVAGLVTDDLVALFSEVRPELEEQYGASPYSNEVSFEEYFMWWFHLFYSAVTDQLVDDGLISLPESGITSFVIAD